ncbi:MAG: NAD-dependent epimerase/dehydratase family protein [Halocynthiibacter sp.]
MGATARVARLVRAGWSLTGKTRALWQARREGPVPADHLFDPLSEPQALARAIPPAGIVLQLSGVTPFSGGALSDNTALALASLKAAEAAKAAHVFLASSAAVYGPHDRKLAETTQTAPTGAYGRAKQEMEQAALSWRRSRAGASPGMTILRIGNVLGADQLIGRNAPNNRVLLDRFESGGGPRRSYIGPLTLANVLGVLFDHVAAGADLPEILNIATPDPVAMSDLLHAAGRSWLFRPAPAQAIESVVLDVSRLSAFYSFARNDSDPTNMMAELETLIEDRT